MARHNIRQREEGRGKKRVETTGKVRQSEHGGMDGRTWVEE